MKPLTSATLANGKPPNRAAVMIGGSVGDPRLILAATQHKTTPGRPWRVWLFINYNTKQELLKMEINTQELISAVDSSIENFEKKSQQRVDELTHRLADLETATLAKMSGPMGGPEKLGQKMAKLESFQALKNREAKSAALTLNRSVKNLVQDGFDSTGDDPYSSQAQRDPRLANNPRRPLTLLEALPSIPVSAGQYEYVSLNGYSNAADEQSAEGATKAESSVPTELKTVKIATIAHWLKASEQILADVPALNQQLADLLTYGVRSKAEALIVGGSGDIQGLETVGQAYNAATGLGLADAVSAAAAQMASDGWLPSHVLVNPSDWHSIRSERDNEGAYVASGWGGLIEPSLWGLSVVESASVSAGSPIVLDASQVAILDRMATVFELFREDSTNVQQNLITARAEARLSLAVFAPSAVRLVNVV